MKRGKWILSLYTKIHDEIWVSLPKIGKISTGFLEIVLFSVLYSAMDETMSEFMKWFFVDVEMHAKCIYEQGGASI